MKIKVSQSTTLILHTLVCIFRTLFPANKKHNVYCITLDPKYFYNWFLATLDERGQGIPNDGNKIGGRKGYQCDQNYNLVERCGVSVFVHVWVCVCLFGWVGLILYRLLRQFGKDIEPSADLIQPMCIA